ncbi:hypothetical protein HY732_00535 [Candidatus Uhrbacteria bacterium]|nr:hypothetical protein [Candidatus Uhrbacteria bacterium]
MKKCTQCKKDFDITDADRQFYKKMSVPEPTLCPRCRDMRRWASGNDITLYRATCDLCKKEMISMYRPGNPYTVYCTACWWSDKLDPLTFGVDYDFSRPFFDQYRDLQIRVPRLAASVVNCENSPYINNCGDMKSCYMCTSCGFCEDSYYLIWSEHSKDCADSLKTKDNELCYELVNSGGSYRSAWLYQCEGMSDSYFCYDCRNCTQCIFSTNLRNKTLHIFNKPVSEQEYKEFVLTLGSARKAEEYKQTWHASMQRAIHKYLMLKNCENVVGDNVSNSMNSYAVFDSDSLENVRYSSCLLSGSKDSMDVSSYGYGCDLSYEGYGLGGSANKCLFTRQCFHGCDALYYSDLCSGVHDLFGCICLRNTSFCILNKKYAESDYHALKEKIIAHMRKTGEYGEYFPGSLSPFGYNESTAMLYDPLSKEDAVRQGYSWNDAMPETKGKETIQWDAVPDRIGDCDESITSQILACTQCGRNYKIIKQELRLLKKLGLPLPRSCLLCRTAARLSLRNPAQFWHRQCMCERGGHDHVGQCVVEFETTYAPPEGRASTQRPELVYCESCYQKEVV